MPRCGGIERLDLLPERHQSRKSGLRKSKWSEQMKLRWYGSQVQAKVFHKKATCGCASQVVIFDR
ncbi:hypothetical protein B0H10DRAFT_2005497 [Mycena sp. CBHHK59/15]|nr:hypothetical protein B0H10DRAFT_2005497 [Mycena sp. CBHHK59/15]